MNVRIVVTKLGVDYDLELFPSDFEVNYTYEAYDSSEIEKIKVPFSFDNKVPYTDNNKGILGYNFSSSKKNFSVDSLPYVLYIGTSLISKGDLYIDEVEVNAEEPYFQLRFEDFVAKFISEVRDLKMSDIYEDAYETTGISIKDFFETYQSFDSRSIELPFIDFDNSQKTFGYNRRQFTGWGLESLKYGLVPSLKVSDFVYKIFAKLGYSVTSEFLNDTGTWSSRNLYMLYPSRLMGDEAGQRQLKLYVPDVSLYIVNEDQETGAEYPVYNYSDLLGNVYLMSPPTNQWNSFTSVSEELAYDYGVQYRSSIVPLPTTNPDERFGFITYSSGFKASIKWEAGDVNEIIDLQTAFLTTQNFKATTTTTVPFYIDIKNVDSAVFGLNFVVYEDGIRYKTIEVLDEFGDPLVLPVANVLSGDIDFDAMPDSSVNNCIVQFEDFDAYLNDTMDVKPGRKYQISWEVVIKDGFILADLVYRSPTITATTITDVEIRQSDIRKQRITTASLSDDLGIIFETNDPYAVVGPDEEFNFALSLDEANTITPSDLLKEIMSRFGMNIFYEYSTDSFYFDSIDDVKANSGSPSVVDIDEYIDDLESYKISPRTDSPKTIKLLNKANNGIYDKFPNELAVGSFSGEYDPNGTGELAFNFIGALINPTDKSVCLNEAFADRSFVDELQLISEQEAGFITNEIPDWSEVGLRFFYLSAPQFPTTIRYPKYIGTDKYERIVDSLTYPAIGTYFMGGISSNEGSTGTLRFADRNGNKLDFYNYFVSLERVKAQNATKMELRVALPVQWLSDMYIFKKNFRFADSNEEFTVESCNGKVYDNYFYGTLNINFL
jgi:hypothetical protein